MSTFNEGHALLVGVGGDLANTVDDAVEMHAILTDEERCAYPPGQVQLLTGEKATRADVLTGLDKLAQSATADSTVIVYFSGHGYQVDTSFGTHHFLMPFGYDQSALATTAVSGQEFAQKLQAIPAQKLLLLLDCCHAGGLDPANIPGATLAKAPLPPEATAVLAQGRGRAIIASSREDELSYAGKPCSAFTLALLEAFCGDGASKQDGQVWVTDLFGHTREKVPQRTGGNQHPVYNHNEADNYVVAFYAGGEVQAKGLPDRLRPENVEIEETPGDFNQAAFDQRGQTVGGNQINISGEVTGPVIGGNVGQIGDSHTTRNVNTGGGAYVERDVNVSGGDFVGGNKVEVSGGFYQSGWTVHGSVNQSTGDLTQHFAPLEAAVQNGPPDAQAKVAELKAEAAKGDSADDDKMADLVGDLGELVPGAVEALVGLFTASPLAKLAGAATKYALRRLNQ